MVIYRAAHGSVRVPLDAIQAVSVENAGLMYKAIRLTVAGNTTAPRSRGFGDYKDAATDPFSLTFWSGGAKKFQAFADRIMAAKHR